MDAITLKIQRFDPEKPTGCATRGQTLEYCGLQTRRACFSPTSG